MNSNDAVALGIQRQFLEVVQENVSMLTVPFFEGGTRYHPEDLYSDLIAMEVEAHDDYGNKVSSEPLFEVKE
jgi:hypothetical protein